MGDGGLRGPPVLAPLGLRLLLGRGCCRRSVETPGGRWGSAGLPPTPGDMNTANHQLAARSPLNGELHAPRSLDLHPGTRYIDTLVLLGFTWYYLYSILSM